MSTHGIRSPSSTGTRLCSHTQMKGQSESLHKKLSYAYRCSRHIKMAPLCKIEMTLPRLGFREKRHGGAVDEQARVQPARRVVAGAVRQATGCRCLCVDRSPPASGVPPFAGLKQDGAPSLLSKRRGKPSNHRLAAKVRALALSLVRERYADFGPTLAAEKLAELHGCLVSRKTLRGWMIADGLWTDRRHRLPFPHQPRRRRDCVGELVQIDGSEHAWFEARGKTCTLLAFVDDATSRSMQLRFVASESAFDYFRTIRAYLQTHGSWWRSTATSTASLCAEAASPRPRPRPAAEQSGSTRSADKERAAPR